MADIQYTESTSLGLFLEENLTNAYLVFDGMDLGCTIESFTLNKTADTVDVVCMQQGSTPVEQVITGEQFSIDATILAPSWAKRAHVSNNVQYTQAGNINLVSGAWGKNNSGPLILIQSENGSPDFTKKFVFYDAVITSPDNFATFGDVNGMAVNIIFRPKQNANKQNIIGSVLVEGASTIDDELPALDWPVMYESLAFNQAGDAIEITWPAPPTASNVKAMAYVQEQNKWIPKPVTTSVSGNVTSFALSSGDFDTNLPTSFYLNVGAFYIGGKKSMPIPNVTVAQYTPPVNVPVTGVTLSETSINLTVGNTQQLTANVAPANATNKSVVWSSLNPAICTVNQSGLVTAVGDGSGGVQVSTDDGDFTADCSVTVTTARKVVKAPARGEY